MSGTTALPIVMTAAGLQPQAPIDLRDQLTALVINSGNSGYTNNLPGGLIEDIASTDTYAIVLCDQAKVELVNSLTPYSANPFILNQLGQMYGIQQGVAQNTSVFVVFSGSVGYVIPVGFVVGDGNYQYIVQDGGIVGASGNSLPVYVVCTTPGTFSVPENTVNQIATSIPVGTTITVNNPTAGTPGGISQTVDDYRAEILQAIRAPAQGMPSYLKTLLQQIIGVQPRLVSMRSVSGGWQILCGGGDPYAVGQAIYRGVSDISLLQGSAISSARNVTVPIIDPPDTYNLTYVNPPNQIVTLSLTWNTTAVNFVSDTAVAQLASNALQNYVNNISAGQPIILFQLEQAFIQALSNVIAPQYITRLVFTLSINGTATAPLSGTGEFVGDPESYFTLSSNNVFIVRG